MEPVVDAFSFTLSFPGADEDFVLLVYDALKDYEDSVVQVALDVEGKIHITVHPVYSNNSGLAHVQDRAKAMAKHVQNIVTKAVSAAKKRYELINNVRRAELALSDGRRAQVLEDLIPSVW